MKLTRSLGILIGWTALGLVVGGVGALVLPKQYVSVAEVAVDSEALSSSGLARFERLSIADGVEVETLVQLLKSSRVTRLVAEKLGAKSRKEIESSLKVVNDPGSVVVKLRATAGSPEKAQTIAKEIVDESVKIDAAKKQQRTAEAIEAVQTQLTDVEKQLTSLNVEIQKITADRGSALSSDQERQQRAAMELAQLEQRLANLNVEGATLENRVKRLDEVIAALPSGKALPPGFETEEAEKSLALAEGRKRLLEQESELASLLSRYGSQHAKVSAAQAEVAATRRSLRDLIDTQRQSVKAQLTDNTNARKIIEQKIAATEATARRADLSLDPAHSNLLAQRLALADSYSRLSSRLSELRVYAGAHPTSFHVFSDPTWPDRASMLRPAAMLALGLVAGGLIGIGHLLRRWTVREHVAQSAAAPSYVQA